MLLGTSLFITVSYMLLTIRWYQISFICCIDSFFFQYK